MKEIVATVTSKGQVTIPREFRHRLGLEPAGKVAFVLTDDDMIALRPVRYNVARLSGILPLLPGRETADPDELIAEAFAEAADRKARELTGS